MAASVNTFSPELLNNISDLKSFFSGKEEIKEISQSENRKTKTYVSELYYNRWQIAWIYITAPFKFIFAMFCEAIAWISSKVGMTKVHQTCTLLAKHQLADFTALDTQNTYGEKFLVSSRNMHDLWTCDYYNTPPLPVSSVQDDEVKELLFVSSLAKEHSHAKLFKQKKPGFHTKDFPKNLKKIHFLNFYQSSGLCRGDTSWWLFLFLSTKKFFRNPYHHVIAVTKLFEKGVSRQAALLHALNQSTSKILNMSFTYSFMMRQEQIDKSHRWAIENLKKLPPGEYGVGLHEHRIGYVKIDDQLGFVRDPNRGAIALVGKKQANQLLKYILKYNEHKKNSEVYFDRVALIPNVQP